MVADSTTIRFKSNAQLGQFNAGATRFNQRLTPAIADSFTFSHQNAVAEVAPQFGISAKALMLRTLLGAGTLGSIATTGCRPEPIEEMAPTNEIKTWAQAIDSINVDKKLGSTSNTTTVTINLKKLPDGMSVEIPTGTATIADSLADYSTGTRVVKKIETPVTVKKKDALTYTIDISGLSPSVKAKILLSGEGMVHPRDKTLSDTIPLSTAIGISGSVDEASRGTDHPEVMFKDRFNKNVFPTQGQSSSVNDDHSLNITTIQEAKDKLADVLPKYGVNSVSSARLTELKNLFDNPQFQVTRNNEPTLMLRTVLNEALTPGYFNLMMNITPNGTGHPVFSKYTGSTSAATGMVTIPNPWGPGNITVSQMSFSPDERNLHPVHAAAEERTESHDVGYTGKTPLEIQLAQKILLSVNLSNINATFSEAAGYRYAFARGSNLANVALLNSKNIAEERLPENVKLLGVGASESSTSARTALDSWTTTYTGIGYVPVPTASAVINPFFKLDLEGIGVTSTSLTNKQLLDKVIKKGDAALNYRAMAEVVGYKP